MSIPQSDTRLQLPSSLENQLHHFRRRVWAIKTAEAVCGAICGVLLSYLTVFALDRFIDTSRELRLAIFAAAVVVCTVVPIYLHRWVWCHRRLDQLARLLCRRYPLLGDQLLGIIELVRNEFEQSRSPALCAAAVAQVSADTARRDLRDAVPQPRHRTAAIAAAVPLSVVCLLVAVYPSAAMNALARFMAPWRPVERYTFTTIETLPERLVVPHGETVTLPVRLRDDTQRRPPRGTVQIGAQAPITSELIDDRYEFELPAQIDEAWLSLRIGDVREEIRVVPMLRPELSSIEAEIQLPEYLERPEPLRKDVRGGALSLVTGSVATLTATANRSLSSATIDESLVAPVGAAVTSAPIEVADSRQLVIAWRDEYNLAGLEPFTISIAARADEPPAIACEDLPRQKVVLVSESLNFKVRAQDDFGVKVVGIEWQGLDKAAASQFAEGEQTLAAGSSDRETIELAGAFCAEKLGIEPQPIAVRLYAEDYLPGRGRAYSPTYTFYVLSAEQHFIWLTEQLSKWHRQSLDVRDREMQLHQTNQQLRLLNDEELDRPETRRTIETQSAAERANGRRLTGLVNNGEELIRQAMRNPEFGVGHLEKWGEMLAVLKDISGNRMPNVADLLKQSSQAQGMLAQAPKKSAPGVGEIRDTQSGTAKPSEAKPKPPVPSITDHESSQQPKDGESPQEEPGKKNSNPRLTLPVTTVADPTPKKPAPGKTPAAEKLDDAVRAQQDLLAEFEKIADELNKVLANLEGSTLVKRLKAASRQQYVVAGKIGDQVDGVFGVRPRPSGESTTSLGDLSAIEMKSSHNISMIMDDMQAYFERRHMQRFKTVLDEMRAEDTVGSLRQLSDDLRNETGMAIAQCEFWSDTFDRWADNLVDPACAGKCPGCKSKGSLPPSIVLEAMQILEAEINLREETRVAEQARAALVEEEYTHRAEQLQDTQDALAVRTGALTQRIRELPDGEADFAYEIGLLGRVEVVMQEAADILGRPETGSAAIGAETEAIELLLRSKRINPRGGGGGGASPGGGGSGKTVDSALALIGAGTNDKELREDHGVSQSTGETGSTLPEEFRAGLDEYFNRLERGGDTN